MLTKTFLDTYLVISVLGSNKGKQKKLKEIKILKTNNLQKKSLLLFSFDLLL